MRFGFALASSQQGLWWIKRPAREQYLLMVASVFFFGVFLYIVAIEPAWQALKAYPSQRTMLDAQFEVMQALQARVQSLKAQPPVDSRAALAALKSAVDTLGAKASLVVVGEQATVTLKTVEARALAQWLANTREGARLVPLHAKLNRDGGEWSGTLQFDLQGI